MKIVELTSEGEWREAFPLMQQLRPHLDEAQYLSLLAAMKPSGYRLFALRETGGGIVALAGLTLTTNLYDLDHLFLYDLVTDETKQGAGFGKQMLGYVEELARANGCGGVTLSSGFQRTRAHRFYEQGMGYSKTGYSFRKRF